jgi:Fe2+ transport system protein FeoA
VERIAPLGDPMDVKIRGNRLSLRRDEASRVVVEVAVSSKQVGVER